MPSVLKYSLLFLTFYSCSQHSSEIQNNNTGNSNTLAHLKWLTGTWKAVSNEGVTYEVWKKENDSLYSGQGFVLKNNDTLFSEKLELLQKGDDLFYIAIVKGQNDEKPVPFKFTEFNKGEFSFVNKDHDFPTRIIYMNPQPDFLCVRIEGTQDGKFRKSDFNFLKVGK